MELLEVYIYGNRVGVLSFDGSKTYFEYDKDFLKSPIELSPLISPKSSAILSYDYPARDSFKGLPEFISDSLPDKFGTDVLDEYLRLQGKSVNELNPLELLSYRGDRAMGALEYIPTQVRSKDEQVNLASLNKISQEIGRDEKIGNLSENLLDLFEIGTSPGGAQPKVLIHIDEEGNIFKGDTTPKPSYKSYLLKFNNHYDYFEKDKGKIEYVYYRLAQEAGIQISPSQLLDIGDEKVFITKRFDRENGEKIHMQTVMSFARMDWKNKTYKYEDLFKILQFLGDNQLEKQELFRRMIFNVIYKNVDDHTKNFSLLMDKQGGWSLAPAYDLVFSAKYTFNQQPKHFLSVNGKRDEITYQDVRQIAETFHVKNMDEIIDRVIAPSKLIVQEGKQLGIKEEYSSFMMSKIEPEINRLKAK